MRLSLIQMSSKEGDRDYNVEKACNKIEEIAQRHPDIIVLPEFFNNEFFPQYRDYKYIEYAEKDDGYTISRMKILSKQYSVYIIATIYEEEMTGLYYDTAMVINPEGNIMGKYRKVHPSAVKSLEKIYFKGGSRFYVFMINGWKVGIIICYDWRFPESMRCLALQGAELVIIPFSTTMIEMWPKALPTRAWENSLYVAACNRVGKEGDWNFPGGSMVVDPQGNILKSVGNREDSITVDLELSLVCQARIKSPIFRDRRPEAYKLISTFEDQSIL